MLASGEIGFGAGAIAGALLVGAAFLAGFSVFRRSASAVCALLMVAAAALLEFSWLGLFPAASVNTLVLLQGLFCAAALVFFSAAIASARSNAVLGGVMFVAALGYIGLGVVSLAGVDSVAKVMRIGMIAVGVFGALLALTQAPRDPGARLVLPGVLIALAAPVYDAYFTTGEATALAPHALFVFGVLAASLVALTEGPMPNFQELGRRHGAAADFAVEATAAKEPTSERARRVSENQLAQVLDYTGVAVWDWSPYGAHQTDGLATLLGADGRSPCSPDDVRAQIHKDDVGKFDSRIVTSSGGDGAFNGVFKLRDGRHIRMRGARAVDPTGIIERIVAFVESASEPGAIGRTSAATASIISSGKASEKLLGALAKDFAGALKSGEIGVVFQPIVNLGTGEVAGYEALARWTSGAGEEKACAEDLVRAAEQAGEGGALARFVLDAAAARIAEQIKANPGEKIFVAFNASYAQLRENGFVDSVRKARERYNLPDKSLVVELTESQAVTDVAAAAVIFTALKDSGAGLAFDDFGAGFSSLSNLQAFAFDYLKIDKSFIDGLTRNDEGATIARAIARLAIDLGLTVIAEGVETSATADAARAIGCNMGQGYAFGAPAAEIMCAIEAPHEKQVKRFWGAEGR